MEMDYIFFSLTKMACFVPKCNQYIFGSKVLENHQFAEVPGGLPPVAPPITPFIILCGRTNRSGGGGYYETNIQPPRYEVGEALL